MSSAAWAATADPVSAAVTKGGTMGVNIAVVSAVCAGVGVGCGIAFAGGGMLQRAGTALAGCAVGGGSPTIVSTLLGTTAAFGLQTLLG